MKFFDEARIRVMAGKGGKGAVSLRREKFVPRGGPDGGNGGRGGSIYAVGDHNLNTLIEYRYQRTFRAGNGESGRGADQYGKAAEDIILRFPVGTIIKDSQTDQVIADLTHHDQVILLAKGGQGGLGNLHFKSSINRAPRQSTPGEEGEDFELNLELKVIADVGLLGMPNAGKSTLISAISHARPKIADYPFTTLYPNLGVVRVDTSRSFVVADIPGLIEGAAEGAGLGHRFLRHLMRTRVLLHLIDIAPIDEDIDPAHSVRTLELELERYSPELAKKTRWLVINKLDLLPPEERDERVQALLNKLEWKEKWFAISGVSGEGCQRLCYALGDYLETCAIPAAPEGSEDNESLVHTEPEDNNIIAHLDNTQPGLPGEKI